jgi:hypothetical protein
VLIVDYVIQLHWPLHHSSKLLKWYCAAVCAWILWTSLYVSLGGFYGCVSTGRSSKIQCRLVSVSGFCAGWFRPSDDGTCYLTNNEDSWPVFQGPILVVIVCGFTSVGYAWYQSKYCPPVCFPRLFPKMMGYTPWVLLQEIASARERDFRRHLTFVLIFFLCWIWPVLHRLSDETARSFALLQLDAIGVTAQVGVLDPCLTSISVRCSAVNVSVSTRAGLGVVSIPLVTGRGAGFIRSASLVLAVSVSVVAFGIRNCRVFQRGFHM